MASLITLESGQGIVLEGVSAGDLRKAYPHLRIKTIEHNWGGRCWQPGQFASKGAKNPASRRGGR